jgi:hypothetical protein
MRNRAQPFLRVSLPQTATVLSAEVGGEAVKLAQGADGTRVPLLRPGFRPNGSYAVSFVYMDARQPLAKKGRADLALPKMDVPVSLVEWEMFVPDRYEVKRFDGNAMLLPPSMSASVDSVGRGVEGGVPGGVAGGVVGGIPATPPQVAEREEPAETRDVQKGARQQAQNAPSQNVFNVQRRVAGVLPVRIDVPRAGVAYRFVRPLVLDETTSVSFEYKAR